MAEYLIVADKPTALDKSRQEALRRGCGPVTLYWWSVIEQPVTKAAALMIETPDDKVALTTVEKTALATKSALDTAGWFPEATMPAAPKI